MANAVGALGLTVARCVGAEAMHKRTLQSH